MNGITRNVTQGRNRNSMNENKTITVQVGGCDYRTNQYTLAELRLDVCKAYFNKEPLFITASENCFAVIPYEILQSNETIVSEVSEEE